VTFRAILDDGKEHKPVLRLMTGEMTPRQIDKEYCGAIGQCPDCEGFLAATDLSGGGTLAAAIADKDRRVKYRRGVYAGGTDQLLSQMHFKHAAGYLQNGLAPCNCKSRNQLIHTEAVEAIAHQYRQDAEKGFTVEAECQFVKPGTPPELYRPDIVVLNQFGGKHTCIEYQRSPEPFDKFVHRHELRGSEWGNAIWFFDDKIWDRKSTCEARDWLFDNRQTFYRCWVDEATLELQVEEGTFATAVVKEAGKKRLRKFVPHKCSEADIINEYLLATGQETDSRQERRRVQNEPPKANRLKGFNIVKRAEADRKKERELFETLKRQKAEREEKERQRRQYHAKMQRLENIEGLLPTTKILDEGNSSANLSWSLDQLDNEVERLHGLLNKAIAEKSNAEKRLRQIKYIKEHGHDFAELRSAPDSHLDELEEQYREIDRKEQAKYEAEQERLNAERKAKQEAAEAQWRAEQQRIAAERQAQWKRDNAERLERQRQQQELERHWHPIKFSEPKRGGYRMTMNLLIGEKVRPYPGKQAEVYQGRSAAGFSTDTHTYPEFEGWEVWKKSKRAS